MNILKGIISEVSTEGQLSIVTIKIDGNNFFSILVDTPITSPFLLPDNQIYLLFKETEVVIAKAFNGQISIQNKFNCIIKSIEKGKLLCKVVMNYNDSIITSIITSKATLQLNLQVGDLVTAMIKTNEINLSQYD